MEATTTETTIRTAGEDQYAWSASTMTSLPLDTRLLPPALAPDARAEGIDLVVGERTRVLEHVGDGGVPERVHDAVEHGGHRPTVRPPLPHAVLGPLLAQAVEGH